MPRRVNASALRKDLYRMLDHVIETGEAVEIERKGRVVRLVVEAPPSKLARLVKRPGFIRGNPEDLVEIEWSESWRP